MNIHRNQSGSRCAGCRNPGYGFRWAIAMAACAAALYLPPVQAAEPLPCGLDHMDIDVTDARYVAGGTDCFTLRLTVHSTGTLSNAGKLTNALGLNNKTGGWIANAEDGWIVLLRGIANSGRLDNFGRVDLYYQSVNDGSFSNFGSVLNSEGFTNSGFFVNQDGIFQSQAPLMNLGSLMNGSGGLLVSSSAMSNVGTITNVAGAQILNSDSIINSGTLTNLGGDINNAGDLRNLGTFKNQLGTVMNSGDLTNVSTLRNGINGTFENFGTVSNLGDLINQALGTLTNYVTLSNQRVLRNETGAVLVNHGRLSNAVGATVENGGTLTNAPGGELTNRGMLTNNSGGTLANQGTLTNEGLLGVFTNRGTVTNAPGGKLVNKATFKNEADAHFANAGAMQNDGTINNAGVLVSTGRVYGSGSYVQTGGSTAIVGGYSSTFSQNEITIDGGQLVGDGRISSTHVVTIGAQALLAPGNDPGDVGALRIDAPLDLLGSLDIDIDDLAHFDSVTVGGLFGGDGVTLSPDGFTWFNFYLGNYASQGAGDTFNFFSAPSFANFAALNFSCLGLTSGLDCGLGVVDGGRGIQLVLFDESEGGVEGVPEPGPLGTMLLGLALLWVGLGWRRCQAWAAPRARNPTAPDR